ncbi:MAG: TIGR01777 family oxidoreductase [Bacteroidota bacterium]
MNALTVVLAGGTGFLGTALATHLHEAGYDIAILSRSKPRHPLPFPVRYLQWDGIHPGEWMEALEGSRALVNLAGRTVNCRYTAKNREAILRSRLQSTRALGLALQQLSAPPPVWLNSSSATVYADTRGEQLANDEYSPHIGHDFSMEVCQSWEECFQAHYLPKTRKVILRTAITLGEGSALKPLIGLAKAGLGGPQGPGNQWVSWIHITDFVRAIEFLIETEDAYGIFNLAAPQPVPNTEFMESLREQVGVNWGVPLSRSMLEIGARLIGTETELILKSRKVISERLPTAGFAFRFPTLAAALEDILGEQAQDSAAFSNQVQPV